MQYLIEFSTIKFLFFTKRVYDLLYIFTGICIYVISGVQISKIYCTITMMLSQFNLFSLGVVNQSLFITIPKREGSVLKN